MLCDDETDDYDLDCWSTEEGFCFLTTLARKRRLCEGAVTISANLCLMTLPQSAPQT
jgi:hypothetical protein